ncbi:Retrovirus-related Pol poly from transposon [Paramuricea clavata]|uniref:Retrovirus-related Pol poly from transposon n=1 Tax=Paramuricea clavata TaxID=317549 RepID=A0A6S7H0L3_PARCT|nr:Retrovirus-related Pol poly from transposon [Paramuricea clavata]
MSDLAGFEPRRIDWAPGPDLPQRLKRSVRQKCELLFDGPLKDRTVKQKCRYVLLWVGDYGLHLYNTWNLSEADQDKLDEYWKRFEQHVKPQSNHLVNRFYLRNLKQNNRPLDEFLTEANLLTQNSGYPDEIHDELMRDALVFGVDSDTVRKKCIAEGNELTLIKAREIARTEEATRQQLKVMTSDISNPIQVDSLQKNRRGNMNRGKTKPLYDRQKGYKMKWDKPVCTRCGNTTHNKDQKCPAIKAQCFGCKKTGHYQNMCFKAIKTNCNSLERDDSYSNEPDIDEKIFLGTLLAEQCPNIGANPNQINSLSTEQRKKVLIETRLTAEPYHKYTTPVVGYVKLTLVQN